MGEWRDTVVGNLLHFSNGRSSPPRHANLQFPVYGSNGIIGSASTSNAAENTIIVGRVGSYCGSLYFAETKCWVTDNAIKANPVDANDAKFLFYLLQTLDLNNRRAGSGQPLLNQQILATIPAYVPEPGEQQAIAAVLSALDDKIELNRRMNETLEASARALFRDWFVDFGPVKAKAAAKAAAQAALGGPAQNDGAKASLRGSAQNHQAKAAPATPTPATLAPEIWPLFPDALDDEGNPDGWEWSPLTRFADINQGRYLSKDAMSESSCGATPVPVHGANGIIGWSTKSMYENGRTLITCRGSNSGMILWADGPLCVSNNAMAVSPHNECTWFSHFQLLIDPPFDSVSGSAQPQITHTALASRNYLKPTDEVCAAFDEIVKPLMAKATGNREESRTLAQTRDMLLPKLMSGEIRVADGARAADDTAGVAR